MQQTSHTNRAASVETPLASVSWGCPNVFGGSLRLLAEARERINALDQRLLLMEQQLIINRQLAAQSKKLSAEAHARTHAIEQQLRLAERQLSISRQLLVRLAGQSTVLSGHAAARAAQISEPKAESNAKGRTFNAVQKLIHQVEESVATDTGILALLVEDISLAVNSTTATEILLAILAQGVIQTLQDRLPVGKQRDAATLLWSVLLNHIGGKQSGPARA